MGVTAQRVVGGPDRLHLGVGQVTHQRRFVELYPLGAGIGQSRQQIAIQRHEFGQPVCRCDTVDALGQGEERQRSDHHGASGNTQFAGLAQFAQHLHRIQREMGVRPDLGHQIVIVGVEPLGHFQWLDALGAAGRREISVQRIGDTGHSRRERAQQDRGIEHLIVEREGADRDRVEPGVLGAGEGVDAQRAPGSFELGRIDAAGPVALDGSFELAPGPDARQPQHCCGEMFIRCDSHGVLRCRRPLVTAARRTKPRNTLPHRLFRCAQGPPARSTRRWPPDTAYPAQPAGLRTHRRSVVRTGPEIYAPEVTYWPSLPGKPSALDGGRSCSPLRDSPGFSPGSLLPARGAGVDAGHDARGSNSSAAANQLHRRA